MTVIRCRRIPLRIVAPVVALTVDIVPAVVGAIIICLIAATIVVNKIAVVDEVVICATTQKTKQINAIIDIVLQNTVTNLVVITITPEIYAIIVFVCGYVAQRVPTAII